MMGAVRALDSGTLSLTKFVKMIEGADITSLTHPRLKADQLKKMREDLEKRKQAAKKSSWV